MVTLLPQDSYPPSPEWSPTILPDDHPHPTYTGRSSNISRMVNNYPKDGTHHLQDGQPEVEFNSREAQLVKESFEIQAQICAYIAKVR